MPTKNLKRFLPSIILCGYERGGTTLLSDLFRANGYESGFECGVLMCNDPEEFKNFQPYYNMLTNQWDISGVKRKHYKSFEIFYEALFKSAFPKHHNGLFFDKTPIYMSKLGLCLSRCSFIEKAVVIHRDPRSVLCSWSKRQKKDSESIEQHIICNINSYAKRYVSYFTGCASHLTSPKVLFVPYEELCTRQEHWTKIIGLFTSGKPFSKITSASRFGNVEGKTISNNTVLEYQKHLSTETQNLILQQTSLASHFFANVDERNKYSSEWRQTKSKIDHLLQEHKISENHTYINNTYFEPFTYLLRYPDVLAAGVNPISHYSTHGIAEKRTPC